MVTQSLPNIKVVFTIFADIISLSVYGWHYCGKQTKLNLCNIDGKSNIKIVQSSNKKNHINSQKSTLLKATNSIDEHSTTETLNGTVGLNARTSAALVVVRWDHVCLREFWLWGEFRVLRTKHRSFTYKVAAWLCYAVHTPPTHTFPFIGETTFDSKQKNIPMEAFALNIKICVCTRESMAHAGRMCWFASVMRLLVFGTIQSFISITCDGLICLVYDCSRHIWEFLPAH